MPKQRRVSAQTARDSEHNSQQKRQTYFTLRPTATAAPRLASTIRSSKRQQTLTQIDFVKRRAPVYEDFDLEKEPVVQSAPPKKRRQTSDSSESIPSTRLAPSKRRSLKLKHLPPKNVNTKTEASEENDFKYIPPAKLMPPPPKTPKKDPHRVIPSSQSPVETPYSLRSQKFLPSQIDSPLKERSVNIRTPHQLKRGKFLVGSKKQNLEVQDTYYENEDSDISTEASLPIPSSSLSRTTSLRSDRDVIFQQSQDLDNEGEQMHRWNAPSSPNNDFEVLGKERRTVSEVDIKQAKSSARSVLQQLEKMLSNESGSEAELPSLSHLLSRSAARRRAAPSSDRSSPTPIARQRQRQYPLSDSPFVSSHQESSNGVSSADDERNPSDGTPTQIISPPRFMKRVPPSSFESSPRLPQKPRAQSRYADEIISTNNSGDSRIKNEQPIKPKPKVRQYGRRSRKDYQSPNKNTEFLVSDKVEERVVTDNMTVGPNWTPGPMDYIETGYVVHDEKSTPLQSDSPTNLEADLRAPSEQSEDEFGIETNALPIVMETETQFQDAFRTFTPPPPLTESELEAGQDINSNREENAGLDTSMQTTASAQLEKEVCPHTSSPPLLPPQPSSAASENHAWQEESQFSPVYIRPPPPPPIQRPIPTARPSAALQTAKASLTQPHGHAPVPPSQATTADLTQLQRQNTGAGYVPASQATTASILSSPILKRGGKPKPISTQAQLSSQGTPPSSPLITSKTDINTAATQSASRQVRVKSEPAESIRHFTGAATDVDLDGEEGGGEEEEEELELEMDYGLGDQQDSGAEHQHEESTMSANLRLGAMFGFKPLTDSQLLPESIMNFRLPRIGSQGELLEGEELEEDNAEE